MKFFVRNLKELKKIATIISKIILNSRNRVFLLVGELGSGKTTLVKLVAKALKIKELITSPTFVLWQKYSFEVRNRLFYLNHLDLYRIKKNEEILKLDLVKEIKKRENFFFIEWGEKIELYLKRRKIKYKKVILTKLGRFQRLVEIR